MDVLDRELRQRAPGYALAARSALALLLADATRAFRLAREPLPALVGAVLELIDSGFRGPMSAAGIAAGLGMSSREMNAELRRSIGTGTVQMIEERRMLEARCLLLGSNHKIDAVAGEVGYGDAHYFRRRFIHRHGVAPATWRQLNR